MMFFWMHGRSLWLPCNVKRGQDAQLEPSTPVAYQCHSKSIHDRHVAITAQRSLGTLAKTCPSTMADATPHSSHPGRRSCSDILPLFLVLQNSSPSPSTTISRHPEL